ncbi:hypothetical protein BC835DRAFT_1329448 [Cytidiella melzeri]|nr:hypothetical protein BC835DRAFT_1329448 [Cytidiella melzeri]
MSEFAIAGSTARFPWRKPTSVDKVKRIREISRPPCNSRALQYWGELVTKVNKKKGTRTLVERKLVIPTNRPLWAPFRAPKGRLHRERHAICRWNPPPSPGSPPAMSMELDHLLGVAIPQEAPQEVPEDIAMEEGEWGDEVGRGGAANHSLAQF